MLAKFFLFSTLFISLHSENTGTITIYFSGLKESIGYLNISIYNSASGFPNSTKSALETFRFKIEKGENEFELAQLPYGEYAISCFQDLNENGELDTNLFGIPKEPVGCSNNPQSSSIPRYADAKFILNTASKNLKVELD